MNFNWNNIDIVRLAIYLALAIAGFVILIKVLKFAAGMLFGFIVTLILAALYYFKIGI